MMQIGSQNVNVEVVHYQVTVGFFSHLAQSGFRTRTISDQRNTEAHGRSHRLDLCEPAALWSVALLQKHRIQKWFFTFVSPELTTHCAQRIPQDEAVFIKPLSATLTFCLWQWTASNTRRASLFPKESLVLLVQIWTLKMKRWKEGFQISEMNLSRRCVVSVDVWRSREKALFWEVLVPHVCLDRASCLVPVSRLPVSVIRPHQCIQNMLLLTSETNWTLWFLLSLCLSVRISLHWLEQIQITCRSGVLTSSQSGCDDAL